MTRQSTALLTIGPKYVGSWADTNRWIVSGSAQLVEGNIPYWLVTPTEPAQYKVTPSEVTVEVPHAEVVVQSILMIVACWFASDDVIALLEETHNVELIGDERRIAPYFDLSDDTVAMLASKLSDVVRLGVTLLDGDCLVDADVVSRLRKLGFGVDVFSVVTALPAAS
jgi:hypothetical protein